MCLFIAIDAQWGPNGHLQLEAGHVSDVHILVLEEPGLDCRAIETIKIHSVLVVSRLAEDRSGLCDPLQALLDSELGRDL